MVLNETDVNAIARHAYECLMSPRWYGRKPANVSEIEAWIHDLAESLCGSVVKVESGDLSVEAIGCDEVRVFFDLGYARKKA